MIPFLTYLNKVASETANQKRFIYIDLQFLGFRRGREVCLPDQVKGKGVRASYWPPEYPEEEMKYINLGIQRKMFSLFPKKQITKQKSFEKFSKGMLKE